MSPIVKTVADLFACALAWSRERSPIGRLIFKRMHFFIRWFFGSSLCSGTEHEKVLVIVGDEDIHSDLNWSYPFFSKRT